MFNFHRVQSGGPSTVYRHAKFNPHRTSSEEVREWISYNSNITRGSFEVPREVLSSLLPSPTVSSYPVAGTTATSVSALHRLGVNSNGDLPAEWSRVGGAGREKGARLFSPSEQSRLVSNEGLGMPQARGNAWENGLKGVHDVGAGLGLGQASSLGGLGADTSGIGLGINVDPSLGLGLGLDSSVGFEVGSSGVAARQEVPGRGAGGILGDGPDSDEELEAIRGSVRRLRDQRAAVERLTEKALAHERSAEELRGKLRDANRKYSELESAGGEQVVWRLKTEVSNLQARLQSLGGALQVREKSVGELREALRATEEEKRVAQSRGRAEGQRTEEQGRVIREQQAFVHQVKERNAALEGRLLEAERRTDAQSAEYRREVESLSNLLREAKAALGASKGEVESKLQHHNRVLDRLQQEKEALLFQRGEMQERVKELTVLCEKQRAKLAEGEERARELQKATAAFREEKFEAERQVLALKKGLTEAHTRRTEEDAGAARKLQMATREAEGLAAQLKDCQVELASKDQQLCRHKEEAAVLRSDVMRLKESVAQQDSMRLGIRERDDLIHALRLRMQQERRERGEWAKARTELLSQFCNEEHKLRTALCAEEVLGAQKEPGVGPRSGDKEGGGKGEMRQRSSAQHHVDRLLGIDGPALSQEGTHGHQHQHHSCTFPAGVPGDRGGGGARSQESNSNQPTTSINVDGNAKSAGRAGGGNGSGDGSGDGGGGGVQVKGHVEVKGHMEEKKEGNRGGDMRRSRFGWNGATSRG